MIHRDILFYRHLPLLMHRLALVFAAISFLLAGCGSEGAQEGEAPVDEELAGVENLVTAQDAFWSNMREHCGDAYSGGLTLEPEGDEMLAGDEELIVHFRQCSDEELRLPFHIEEGEDQWDRSRTWVFMKHEDALELRHDHREPDGLEEENTWYGGATQDAGTANRQQFLYEERTADDGSPLGWRVEIEPNQRYTYGTIRGNDWTWRVDFDLTERMDTPPAPWGHEDTQPYDR